MSKNLTFKSKRTLMNTNCAAEYLGVSSAFLERDRWNANRSNIPPSVPFVKIGKKTIRYRSGDLEQYIENNLYS